MYLFLSVKRTDYHQLGHNHVYPRRGLAVLGGLADALGVLTLQNDVSSHREVLHPSLGERNQS